MKKETGKKSEPDKKAGSNGKYILLTVILLLAGYFTYTEFIAKDKIVSNKPVLTDPREKIKNVKEPEFKKEGDLNFLKPDGKTVIKSIDIEIADRDEERMQGLMYRKSMDDSRGMLFIFQREEEQSFWMKNTIMSLDIIYVNGNKEIIKIYKHTTPFSEKSLPSEKPAEYVVEVAAGYTDRYGINEGDKINFNQQK